MRRKLLWAVAIVLGTFVVIQAVPYGRTHANPRPTREARLADPQARAAFDRACADCHSDRTDWRWYTNIAPISWLVQNDVDGGRGAFNLSEWDKPQPDLSELVEQIDGGGMPPLQYTVIHSSARLSSAQKRTLVEGLRALYATDPPAIGAGG
jgi:Haem-binding domain